MSSHFHIGTKQLIMSDLAISKHMIKPQNRLIEVAVGLFLCISSVAQTTNKPIKPVETDPHWLANEPGYYLIGRNGEHINLTNMPDMWCGIWVEDNNGWRVQLTFFTDKKTFQDSETFLRVELGSIGRQVNNDYYLTPNGKFAQFKLLDSRGHIVSPKSNAGTNLLRSMQAIPLIYDKKAPKWALPIAGSLEANFPMTISTNMYPLTPNTMSYISHQENGSDIEMHPSMDSTNLHRFKGDINGLCWNLKGAGNLGYLNLNGIYAITKEDDYTIIVQPVIYTKSNTTNPAILDRVDLPTVTTKIHLLPSVK